MKIIINFTIILFLTMSVHGDEKIWIKKVYFEGVHYFSQEKLKNIISSKESKLGRKKPFFEDSLAFDLKRISSIYIENGFLQVNVREPQIQIEKIGDTFWVTVRIIIEEGRRTLVSKVEIYGNRYLEKNRVLDVLSMNNGKAFVPKELANEEYAISFLYANEGYVLAEVKSEVEYDSMGNCILRYKIDEGTRFQFGKIKILGNHRTNIGFISERIGFQESEVFSMEKLATSRRKLMETRLFQDVVFIPEKRNDKNSKIDVNIQLSENKHRWLEFGTGYGGADQGRLSMGWGDNHLFGRGKQISIRANFGSQFFPRFHSVFLRQELSYGDPFLMKGKLRWSVTGYYEHYRPTSGSYQVRRFGSSIGIANNIGKFGDISLDGRYERNIVSDTLFFSRVFAVDASAESLEKYRVTRSIGVMYTLDRRNSTTLPVSGGIFRISLEYAGGIFGGDDNFLKGTGMESFFFSPFPWIIFCQRFQGGRIFGFQGENSIPIYERFFSGGANSLRGYPEGTLSPKNEIGKLIGGKIYFVSNIEVRVLFFSKLGLGFFFDFGEVRDGGTGIKEPGIRKSFGGEFHYLTPIGPLRFSYGRNINPTSYDTKGRFYFSTGYAF